MEWQIYQFPLEIQSSSRKQSGMFDSIKRSKAKRSKVKQYEHRRKTIKIKRTEKVKANIKNFEKSEKEW